MSLRCEYGPAEYKGIGAEMLDVLIVGPTMFHLGWRLCLFLRIQYTV